MEAQTIIAKRIAQELRSGMLINLGIGIPTLVANYVPPGVNVFFQSENGLIGTGPIPEEGMAHPTLTDAAGHPVLAWTQGANVVMQIGAEGKPSTLGQGGYPQLARIHESVLAVWETPDPAGMFDYALLSS